MASMDPETRATYAEARVQELEADLKKAQAERDISKVVNYDRIVNLLAQNRERESQRTVFHCWYDELPRKSAQETAPRRPLDTPAKGTAGGLLGSPSPLAAVASDGEPRRDVLLKRVRQELLEICSALRNCAGDGLPTGRTSSALAGAHAKARTTSSVHFVGDTRTKSEEEIANFGEGEGASRRASARASLTPPGAAVAVKHGSITGLMKSGSQKMDVDADHTGKQDGDAAPEEQRRLSEVLDLGEDLVWDDRSDSDLEEEPKPKSELRQREHRGGVSAEAYGAHNQRRAAYIPPSCPKTLEQKDKLLESLEKNVLFRELEKDALSAVVEAMPVENTPAGSQVCQQGEEGDCLYVILSGSVNCYIEAPGDVPPASGLPAGKFVRLMPNERGCSFGELAMLWSIPRTVSVWAKEACELAKLSRDVYQNLVQRWAMRQREQRDECLRKVKMFETMADEQLALIGDALEKRSFEKDKAIINQGEEGTEFFIVLKGECAAMVHTGKRASRTDVQEHRRYSPGDLFGERALIQKTVRGASVIAMTSRVEVLCLSRAKFDRLLGSFGMLQQSLYNTDPRKEIADFYRPGDSMGPAGVHRESGAPIPGSPEETLWFAVYRPTSRDAIAKMLAGIAVGKGLNVKGKSSKKNRMSGFVPFLQISDNAHRKMIEESPPDTRFKLYYTSQEARASCIPKLTEVMSLDYKQVRGDGGPLHIQDRSIHFDDQYVELSQVWGIDVPEAVLTEAYIQQQDITHLLGWETGRKSEPAFMDMNLHAVRRPDVEPLVVLYQMDQSNPMNPHGLLIAYAERQVKPVVSDFDTFTIGSQGMEYDPLTKEQAALAMWSLEQTEALYRSPGTRSWTSRWLEVLKQAADNGFHPDLPKYGFGDATSYSLIGEVVQATRATGAVRHGAECFNFYFPQELDEDYLVVWPGFPDKPWEYKDESELREWLLERITEGYSFPLNPVWTIRDDGWWEVYEKLRESQKAQSVLRSWYPPDSGITEKMEAIHEEYPNGFEMAAAEPTGSFCSPRATVMGDAEGCENAEFLFEKMRNHGKLNRLKTVAMRTLTGLRAASRLTTLGSQANIESLESN